MTIAAITSASLGTVKQRTSRSSPSASAGGCDFPVDPCLAPPGAPVLWMPQEDTSVVLLTSLAAGLSGDDPLPCPELGGVERHDAQGWHDRCDLGNGQSLQLLYCDTAGGATALAALIPLGRSGFDRLEAVGRLLAALHARAVPPDTRLTPQQRARSRRMLRAFDGARDGATQQEIARALFRIGPFTRDEWQAASARHQVMALLRDGRALIAGGYRKLLRHRRRH